MIHSIVLLEKNKVYDVSLTLSNPDVKEKDLGLKDVKILIEKTDLK